MFVGVVMTHRLGKRRSNLNDNLLEYKESIVFVTKFF